MRLIQCRGAKRDCEPTPRPTARPWPAGAVICNEAPDDEADAALKALAKAIA